MALRNGSRFSVGMADVFPDGCYLVPGSISEAQDYDEKTKTRQPGEGQGDRDAGVPVPGRRTWTRSWRAGRGRRW